jgi:hypothetical protein
VPLFPVTAPALVVPEAVFLWQDSFMPFVSRTQVRRPKRIGRPPKEIPRKLAQILDETFTGNSAFTEDVTETVDADLLEVLKLGALHADRRGLSFRHRVNEDNEGRVTLTMWLCPKQKYTPRRKAAA